MAQVAAVSTKPTVRRHVARAIVLDPLDRVLLFYLDASRDPDGRGYWYPPGGGIRPGESPEMAVIRELREEAGIETIELGPRLLHLIGVRFEFEGRRHEQDEWHIVARVPSAALGAGDATDLETSAVAAHRWWSLDDLAASSETIYPLHLEATVRAFLSTRTPGEELELEARPAPP